MNFTYLPMGSMQLGPNGELIPTSIPSSIAAAAAGRGHPTYHTVAAAAAAPNGSTHNWKMSDLAPLYTTSHGHSFAVMDPLSSGHASMVPMAITGHFDANGQFVQQLQAQPVAIPVPQNQLAKEDEKHLQTMVRVKEEHQVQQQQQNKQPQLTTLQTARLKPFQVYQDQQGHQNVHHGQNVQFQHVQLQQQQHLVPGHQGAAVIHAQQQQHQQQQQHHHQQQQQLTQQAQQPAQQPAQHVPQQQQQRKEVGTAVAAANPTGYTIVDASETAVARRNAVAIVGDSAASDVTSDDAEIKSEGGGEGKGKKVRQYACSLCDGKDFKSRGNLKRHLKDFHESGGTDKVTFHCDLCRKDFQNRFNLRRHRLGVHGALEHNGRTYPCDICLKTFHYSDNLKRHKRNVHGVEMTGSETEPEPTEAELEGIDVKLDPNASSPGNKNFICDLCDKNMQSSYNLKRHKVAVHKDTRILYGCDECDKNFTSITNYRRHKIMIHGPGKQAYKCENCDKILASKDGLKRHMESIHQTLEKTFVCDLCGSKFLRKEYLEKHRKTHEFNYAVLPADSTTMAPQTISSTQCLL